MEYVQQLREESLPQAATLPEELGPGFLGLVRRQRVILTDMLGEVMQELVAIQFNEPEKLELRLRQHAELHGRMEILKKILGFDAVREQEMRDKHSASDELGNSGLVEALNPTAF